MNEFVKPKRIIINPVDYIKKISGNGLIKDLHGNEEICDVCHGTGIIIEDNVYGLSDDPNRRIGIFPYKHQSFTFCRNCYNGIIHRCKLCGEIIRPRGFLKHDCEKQKELDRIETAQKEKEMWDKAEELPEEKLGDYNYFYSQYYGYNEGYFSDFDEFFEYWHDNEEYTTITKDERPKFVWVTDSIKMNLDADDIVSNVTEELYEDAFYDISSEDMKHLQDFLDEWCKTCGVSDTYYESHKYKVRIPWEYYDKEYDNE